MAGMVSAEASILGDEMIMEQILATHAPNGTKLDVKSLLNIVTNILNRASHIVDGAITGTQAHLEKVEDKPYNLEFETPPIVEKLSCQMMCSCKASDHSNLHETTLSVFSHLSGYSWDAKVVLALSAYAMNYGDFWLLEQIYPQDQLAMPMAVLKRLSVLNKPPAGALKNRIVAISTLTKIILEVTESIAEIEKLSVKNNPMDVPALANAMAALPMAVYSTIKTVIACASQITSLTATTNESQTTLLLTLTPKLNMTLGILKEFLAHCKKSIDENKRYQMLLKLTVTHTDNIEVLKAIICTKNDILIDLSTKRTVKVDYLRKKHVLLVISGLDISSHVIATLKQTYEGCRIKGKGFIPRLIGSGQEEDRSFEVVWVPVVEQWSLEAIQKFELVKADMPWYTVHNLSSVTDTAVLKFYRQVWQYQGKPIAPVISRQGNFESLNAFPAINVWGSNAFPFTETKQMDMWKEHTEITMELIMGDTHPDVTTWIQNEQFVLFYGGTDTKWTNVTLQEVAKSFHEKMDKSVLLINVHKNTRFWDRIESLLACKMENDHQQVDEVMHKMQELLGYKKEEKWGMLCMGSKVLISGLGDSVVVALSQDASDMDMDDPTEWVIALIESHNKVTSLDFNCCHYRFPSNAGRVPQTMKCVKCHRVMEKFITFQCCHKDLDVAANGPC